MNSIFQRSNPAIEKLFAKAGKPEKVMCIPIDYAKRQHTALVCNGSGLQLRGPFNIHNTPEGVDFLNDIVNGLCKKHSIRRENVFFGGEDCGGFSFNFIHALLNEGYFGIGMNAHDAAEERKHQVASTDKLDLLGIASMLIKKKQGRTLSPDYSQARIMRDLTRHRNALVKARVAASYRIHHLVDQLLPGFLDVKQSPITPFSDASLWLMSQNFSPRQILARKTPVLAEKFRLFMIRDAETKVAKIKQMARSVLPPPVSLCETLQINLGHEVTVYQHIDRCIQETNKDIARRLAVTPGAMLTSVQGIGITNAASLYAEIGDPNRDRALKRLCSYAGLVARLKQSGGPDKEAYTIGRSRRACVPLKRCMMDIALKIGQYGNDDMKADYQRRVNEQQDVRLTMGRKMLRICTHLIRNTDFFFPPSILNNPDQDVRQAYILKAWDQVLIKWRNAGAIQQAFSPDAPLEKWRLLFNELYNLNLSKLSPQVERLRDR